MIPRPRLYIIIGAVGCALIIVLRDSLVSLALLGAALGVTAVSLFLALGRMADRHRDLAFKVSDGRFAAPAAPAQGAAVMLMLVGLGSQVNSLLQDWAEPDQMVRVMQWVMLGALVLFGVFVALVVVLTWHVTADPVELTPQGVHTRILWDRRFIPWEALAPGGPHRPRQGQGRIRLGLTRPELVRRSSSRSPGWDTRSPPTRA